MATRGSIKQLSVEQEDFLASIYNGKRSKSSGAAQHDAGDVRCARILIEAKMTKSVKPPAWIKDLEKITKEAYEEGREPVLAQRFYKPDSILANRDGWVDVVIRKADEDALREEAHVSNGSC